MFYELNDGLGRRCLDGCIGIGGARRQAVLNRNPGNVVLAGTRAKQKKARAYGTRTDATYHTRYIAYGTRLKLRTDARNIFLTSRE